MAGCAPLVNLETHLAPSSIAAVTRIAYEFGFSGDELDDVRNLAWLARLMEFLKDTNRNFPNGKFATIRALKFIVGEAAEKSAKIYYGGI